MCLSCEKLRERVKELETALTGYETSDRFWTFPYDAKLTLTQSERQTLRILYERRPNIILREGLTLAYAEFSRGHETDSRKVLDVHICRLRKKIQAAGWTIKNVFGVGYKLEKTG